MFLQFSPAVKQKKGVKKETNQEQEVLSLAPFTANPKISFENIKIGKTAVRKLIIQNPRNQRAEVTAKITFPEELSMQIDWEEQIIEPNQEVILEVTWTPQSDGIWRVVLHVDGNNVRKKVSLVLKAIKSTKKTLHPEKSFTRKQEKDTSEAGSRRNGFWTKSSRHFLSKQNFFKSTNCKLKLLSKKTSVERHRSKLSWKK